MGAQGSPPKASEEDVALEPMAEQPLSNVLARDE
jgi:hypothetical protein